MKERAIFFEGTDSSFKRNKRYKNIKIPTTIRILENNLSPKSRKPKATPELKVRKRSMKGMKLCEVP
jgi:hypothetical protein